MEVLMKISNNNGFESYPLNLNDVSSLSKSANKDSAKNSTASFSNQDTVSLSDDAKYHTIAAAEAQNTPVVRADKVAYLKNKISNGTYQFSSRATAEGIVKDMYSYKQLFTAN